MQQYDTLFTYNWILNSGWFGALNNGADATSLHPWHPLKCGFPKIPRSILSVENQRRYDQINEITDRVISPLILD